jgi:hypothetical protein
MTPPSIRMSAARDLAAHVVHRHDRRRPAQDERPHPAAPRSASASAWIAGVRGREDPPAAMGRAARPVRHDPARCLDDGDGRVDVVGLQPGLDHEVDLPRGDERVGVAVHPVAGQPDPVGDAAEGEPLVLGPDFGEGGEEERLRQRPRRPRGDRRPPARASALRPAKAADEAFADVGLVDHAEDGPARVRHGHEHPPGRRAAEVGARPVDGVDHPRQPARAGGRRVLLAQDCVVRAAAADDLPDRDLGCPVGHRHGVEVGALAVGRKALRSEVAERLHPRRVCRLFGDRAQFGLQVVGK